jgi:hypothetical protein
MGNEYSDLVGKAKGKRLFGRPRRRCEDNTEMDLKDIVCDDMVRIPVAREMVQ